MLAVTRNMTECREAVEEESIDLKVEFSVPKTFPNWSINIDSEGDSEKVLEISEDGIKFELSDGDVQEASYVEEDSSSLDSFTTTKAIVNGGETHSQVDFCNKDVANCKLFDGDIQASCAKNSSLNNHTTKKLIINRKRTHCQLSAASTVRALGVVKSAVKFSPSNNSISGNEDAGSMFQCSSLATLERHIQMHKEKHLQLDEIGLLNCSICGQCFIDDLELSIHLQVHFQDSLFRCTQCDLYFRKKASFTVHLRKHSSESGNRCKTCGNCISSDSKCCLHFKTYSNSSVKRRRHDVSLVKPVNHQMFECQVCRKCFLDKSDLSLHMSTHS